MPRRPTNFIGYILLSADGSLYWSLESPAGLRPLSALRLLRGRTVWEAWCDATAVAKASNLEPPPVPTRLMLP